LGYDAELAPRDMLYAGNRAVRDRAESAERLGAIHKSALMAELRETGDKG